MVETKRGCLKYGCMGCGAIVGIPTLVIVVLLVLGLLTGGREERIEPLDRSQPIPASATIARAVEGDEANDAAPGIDPESVEIREPGRIVLDVGGVLAFSIRPGPPGQPIRLEGHYDAGKFELEESYESYGELGWIYRLSFSPRGFGLRPFIGSDLQKNTLRLIVPRDAPFILEGSIGLAESNLELGGLWLVDFDLEVGLGEHRISFDAPIPVPLDRFRLDHSIGELRVDSLGHASPRTVDVTRSIGSMHLDLNGNWRNDSNIDVSCGIGECRVEVPDDVQVVFEGGGVLIGDTNLRSLDRRSPVEPGTPVLHLTVGGRIGEVTVK